MEKWDKRRTLKNSKLIDSDSLSFHNGLGPLSSYPLRKKASIQSSSCNSRLFLSPVANSRSDVNPLQRRSTGTREKTRRVRGSAEGLAPENVFELAIGKL